MTVNGRSLGDNIAGAEVYQDDVVHPPANPHQRPSAPTNLTLHQATDINVPVGCGDVGMWPGDVVVGDGEGVVVIPAEIADEVAAEAVEMTVFEDFVQERLMEGRSILGCIRLRRSKSASGRWSVGPHLGHQRRTGVRGFQRHRRHRGFQGHRGCVDATARRRFAGVRTPAG